MLPGHRKILHAVLVIHEDGDQAAAQDAAGIGDNGEKKYREDGGVDARRDQLAHRVHAQGAHGVNLLGDDHRAQFTGHRTRVATAEHNAGQHRPQLADHNQTYKLAGDGGGAKGRQRGRRLQRQHTASRQRGENHNWQRAEADNVGLHQKFRPVDRRMEEIRERAPSEQGVILHHKHEFLGGILDCQDRHRVSRSAELRDAPLSSSG